ncbi:MAG: YceI family protein [Chitinophagales bacterium]|nr:YceI family protein [Chitinophagales bacterium]MDW8394099.1 YceI family protein [Chitinophagales bacterium]
MMLTVKRLSPFAMFISIAASSPSSFAQKAHVDKQVNISFFSEAPLENIDAHTKSAVGVIDMNTGAVFFKVPIKTFTFKKALMQEHFNENYMESDKYPHATLKGQIINLPDPNKDGTYSVTVEGDLTIHGVTQKRQIPGTLVIKGNELQVTSEFDVRLADHNITIPKLVIKNIAEVVQVKVSSTLVPSP